MGFNHFDGEGRAHGRRAAFLQYAAGHVYGDLIHGNFIIGCLGETEDQMLEGFAALAQGPLDLEEMERVKRIGDFVHG